MNNKKNQCKYLCYLCFDIFVCDVWNRKKKWNICLLDQTQLGQRQMQMLLLSEGLTILCDLGVGRIWIWLANKPAKLWLFLLGLSVDLIATQAQECKEMWVQLGHVFAPIRQVNLEFACLLRASSGSFPTLHISGLAAPERHFDEAESKHCNIWSQDLSYFVSDKVCKKKIKNKTWMLKL